MQKIVYPLWVWRVSESVSRVQGSEFLQKRRWLDTRCVRLPRLYKWRALRPPRVVFIIGCVSCNKFFTSGKNTQSHKATRSHTTQKPSSPAGRARAMMDNARFRTSCATRCTHTRRRARDTVRRSVAHMEGARLARGASRWRPRLGRRGSWRSSRPPGTEHRPLPAPYLCGDGRWCDCGATQREVFARRTELRAGGQRCFSAVC